MWEALEEVVLVDPELAELELLEEAVEVVEPKVVAVSEAV